MKNLAKKTCTKVRDVVLIGGDDINRGKWTVGIVKELVTGRDDIVRVVKLRTKTPELERAIQMLYPLELSCDLTTYCLEKNLNPKARV